MTNREKIISSIAKLLDQVTESVDKKEAIDSRVMMALSDLARIATSYSID